MQVTTPPDSISMKIINKDTGEIIEDQTRTHYSWLVIGDYYSGEYTTEFFFKEHITPIAVSRFTVYDDNGNIVNNVIFKDRGEGHTIDRIYSVDTVTGRTNENLSTDYPVDFLYK